MTRILHDFSNANPYNECTDVYAMSAASTRLCCLVN
jgi:hypothetical protein